MAAIAGAFGRLDLLVNNAGTNLRKLAVDVTREEWDDMIAVNVSGTFFLTQQAGRHMIAAGQGGAIVTIASTHAVMGAPERSTYGIAKAAVVQMTRMLAVEWARHKIRVNAIAPGTHGDGIALARREGLRSRRTWRRCSSASRCTGSARPRRWRRRWSIWRVRRPRRSPGRC